MIRESLSTNLIQAYIKFTEERFSSMNITQDEISPFNRLNGD